VAERLIDVPIESLPFVDEHSISIDASPETIWQALLETVKGGFAADTSRGRVAVRLLDCEPSARRGEPGRIGSTIPGFIVARAIPPAVLALMGEHRFSRYALVFRITERDRAPTLISAETRAEFPGRGGRLYRLGVIGSRAHVLATRAILRGIRRRARRLPSQT
jgi:hypothetical protein